MKIWGEATLLYRLSKKWGKLTMRCRGLRTNAHCLVIAAAPRCRFRLLAPSGE